MRIHAHIEGVEELANIAPRIPKSLVDLVKYVSKQVRIRMAAYPPETGANQPGPYPTRWYQRHFGPRWGNLDGSTGGSNTSQMLQKSWKDVVSGPLERTVWTPVDYAPFVQSAEMQTSVMRDIGWHTDEQIVDEVMRDPRTQRRTNDAIDKALEA